MTDPDFYVVLHGHDDNFTHGFGPFVSVEEAKAMIDEDANSDTCDKRIVPIRAVMQVMMLSVSDILNEVAKSLGVEQDETPPSAPRDPRKDMMN